MGNHAKNEKHFKLNLITSHLPDDVELEDADGTLLAEATSSFVKETQTILPVRTEGNKPELWGYREGIWKPDGKQKLRELIAPVLGAKYSQHLLRETADRLRAQHVIDREEMGLDEPLIPCRGSIIVDPETDELRDYSPDDLATWKLQAKYNPNAKCPEFESFLDDVLPTKNKEEIRKTLYEFLAYATQPHTRHQRALFLLGPTRTGKSTLLDVIRTLFGEDSDGCQTLQKLASNRFALAELEGKPINVRSDLSSSLIQNTGLIKELIAGERASAERKHLPPFIFKPRTKLFFSANTAPGRNINDEAFWRRWITIPMEQQIPPHKRDPRLIEKLTTELELSGILNKVIDGLQRLRESGFTYAPSVDENKKLWRGYGSTEEEFIYKFIDTDTEAKEEKQQLYDKYKSFASRQNSSPVSVHQLTKAMKKLTNARVAQRQVNGTRDYYYLGVRLNSDKLEQEVLDVQDNGGIPL